MNFFYTEDLKLISFLNTEKPQDDFNLKEMIMLSMIGALVNIGIIIYLGIHAKECFDPEQLANLEVAQNPLVLSFVAILALFLVIKNK